MKVLHYPSIFLAPSETFIGRYIQSSERWAEICVMSDQVDHSFKVFKGLDKVQFHRLPARRYSSTSIAGFLRYGFEKICQENMHLRVMRKVLAKLKPDVVHCHFGPQGVLFNKATADYNSAPPYIVSFYGYDATKKPLEDSQYKRDLESLFDTCSGIFVEGPHFRDQLLALGAPSAKIRVNPILIPVKQYPQKEGEYLYCPGQPVKFLLAGRFVEKKGFHLFFEAIGRIKDKLPAFEIEVIGEGALKEQYNKVIKKFALSPHINFLGWKSHPDLLKQIKQADFFVHPSTISSDGDTEGGAPTILLEAQAIKTPVIASNHADIPFIMGYDDFLCKEGDIEELKSKILKAINCNNLSELVEQGYNKVLQQHDISSDIYRRNIESLM